MKPFKFAPGDTVRFVRARAGSRLKEGNLYKVRSCLRDGLENGLYVDGSCWWWREGSFVLAETPAPEWTKVDENETHVLWRHANGGECCLSIHVDPNKVAAFIPEPSNKRELGKRGYVDTHNGATFGDYIPRDAEPAKEPMVSGIDLAAPGSQSVVIVTHRGDEIVDVKPSSTRAERVKLGLEPDTYARQRRFEEGSSFPQNEAARARLLAALKSEKPRERKVASPSEARSCRVYGRNR